MLPVLAVYLVVFAATALVTEDGSAILAMGIFAAVLLAVAGVLTLLGRRAPSGRAPR